MSFKIMNAKLSDFRHSSSITHQKASYPSSISCIARPKTSTIWAHVSSDGEYIFAYHHEKVRKKVTRLAAVKNKKVVFKSSIQKGYWKNTIYKFAVSQVISFTQHARHFDIVLK